MIASSLKEGEEIVDLLLNKGADVNMKSEDQNNRTPVTSAKLS